MKKYSTVLIILLGLVLLFVLNFLLFTGALQGLPAPVKQALESSEVIQVTYTFNKLIVEPTHGFNTGLILYGEGGEDVRTYAPIAQMLAKGGVKVVILGRRLRENKPDDTEFERIEEIMHNNPEYKWYIGGHTWGAQIPVRYALAHEGELTGIVLWAARLSEDSDIADTSLPVLYVYGTLDDANVQLVEKNRGYVPPDTEWVSIEGANRADFSYWGPMAADVGSTIPIPEIQKQASQVTLDFLTRY